MIPSYKGLVLLKFMHSIPTLDNKLFYSATYSVDAENGLQLHINYCYASDIVVLENKCKAKLQRTVVASSVSFPPL